MPPQQSPQMPGMPPAEQPNPMPSTPMGGGTNNNMPVYGGGQPPKSKKGLVIALVVIALLVLGAAAWWWMSKGSAPSYSSKSSNYTSNKSTSTSFNPKVHWVVPTIISAAAGSDGINNSDADSIVYSYPDPDGCMIDTLVTTFGSGSKNGATAKEVALNFEGASDSSTTISRTVAGPMLTFKDTKGTSYQFDSLELDVDSGDGKETVIIAYKAFDNYAVALDYGCSTSNWAAQKDNEKLLVDEFTLKID